MIKCTVAMRSQTASQRAIRALGREDIPSELVNIEPTVTKNGCTYGVRISIYHLDKAIETLKSRDIPYGEVIGR